MNNLRIVLTGHPRKVSLSCNPLIRQECLKPSAALLSNCNILVTPFPRGFIKFHYDIFLSLSVSYQFRGIDRCTQRTFIIFLHFWFFLSFYVSTFGKVHLSFICPTNGWNKISVFIDVLFNAVEVNGNCNVHIILVRLQYPNYTGKLFPLNTASKWILVFILEINVYFITQTNLHWFLNLNERIEN